MQNLWLIIVVFFLVLLILPICANLHISYDVLSNIGSLSLYILFIKIFAYKLKFKGKQIVFMSQQETKDVELEISQKQMRFLEQLNVQLKEKVIVKKISIFSRIGMQDACLSAVLSGLFTSLAYSFLAYIKNTKKSAKILLKNDTNCNGKNLIACMSISCTVTIFDMLYSLFMALVIIKRSEKYERV